MTQAPTPCLQLDIEQTHPMPLRGHVRCNAGQMLALVGPSGAGKTSLLRVMAGLLRPQAGRVQVAGQVWCDTAAGIFMPPQARHVGLVFQDYALMPHLSALGNVALSLLHLPKAQRLERAAHWLGHVKLSAEQQHRRPAELSGGQQQRVAVARALAREPALLLLDEPFSAVDPMNRQGLYALLAQLRAELHIPIVLVTHDLHEARMLADTLVVMDGGEVLQQGAPAQLYRSPRNARVADLVGIQNRFHGRWLGPIDGTGRGGLRWLPAEADQTHPGLVLQVQDKGRLEPGQEVTWVVQSEGLQVAPQSDAVAADLPPHSQRLSATLQDARNLGEISLATLALDALPGVTLQLTLSGPIRQHLAVGQRLCLTLDCSWVHVMPVRQRATPWLG
jgi:molybdate transport system ATP-binding protein